MKRLFIPLLILMTALPTVSAEDDVHISTAAELLEISKNVLSGTDYSNTVIYLDDDIDLSGSSWSFIGTEEHPFEGTFDGQGHRIKNLKYSNSSSVINGAGLFGAVTGTTTIRNVVLDSSCSISSVGSGYYNSTLGTAGFVGYFVAKNNCSSYTLTIDNCGNEAAVTGKLNTAGFLGWVSTDIGTIAKTYINNCYNTGAISGSNKTAGFIIGTDIQHVSVVNTWVLATISGYNEDCPFGSNESGCSYTHCYMAHDTNHPYTQEGVKSDATESIMLTEHFIKSLNDYISSTSNPSAYTTWVYDGQPDSHPCYRNDSQRAIPIVKLNEQGFATYSCVKSYSIELQTSGVKMYKAAVSGTTITLTELTGAIPRGTGFIIYGGTEKAGQEVEFVQTAFATDADVTGNELKPTTTSEANPVAVPTTGYNYVMGSDGQFNLYSGTAFASNRAYFNFSSDPLANPGTKFSIVWGDDPTIIENINNDIVNRELSKGHYYNLVGQKVDSDYRGIVIINGKKLKLGK